MNSIFIRYEQLMSEAKEDILQQICRLGDLGDKEHNQDMIDWTCSILKQNPFPIEKRISNYEEILKDGCLSVEPWLDVVSIFRSNSLQTACIANQIGRGCCIPSDCPGQRSSSFCFPKLNFLPNPNWSHHHNNAFDAAYDAVKRILHSSQSKILFIPAVEMCLCDDEEEGLLKKHRWIGIIHSVPESPNRTKWVPDLNRLCSSAQYKDSLQNCLGLFTLTSVQKQYLQHHLSIATVHQKKIEICQLYYPFARAPLPPLIEQSSKENSHLAADRRMKYGKILHIGEYERDLEWYYNVNIPSSFEKLLLISDHNNYNKLESTVPSTIKLLPRVDAVVYEEFLMNYIVCLAMTVDGAANTIVLECIQRNIPIIVPNNQSIMDYLGEQYPLYYQGNPKQDHLNDLLTFVKIEQTINYLQQLEKTKFACDYFVDCIINSSILHKVESFQ